MKNSIVNPYISIDVDENSIDQISKSISIFLNDLNIPYTKSKRAHISLAYILGTQEKKFLEELVSEITEDKFAIRVIGISILDGKITGKNYLVLDLESETDFGYAHDFICENCEVNKIGDKFVAHISLFELDNGIIPQDQWFNFCRVLEMHSNNSIAGKVINGNTVSVFNQNREKELSFRFRSK